MDVLYQIKGAVAIITLNRPEAYNTITKNLTDRLAECMTMAEKDNNISAIILTGSGQKAFSAGLDLKVLTDDPSALSDDTYFLDSMNHRTKPLIGAINGYAITGGFELALMCDILVASPNAIFSDTHAKVGLIPGWGLSQKLQRIIGAGRAKEMSFTAKKVDAQTALKWGLINHIYPQETLLDEALKLANDIAHHDTTFIQKLRHVMDTGANMSLEDSIKYEYDISVAHNKEVDYSQMNNKLQKMRAKK